MRRIFKYLALPGYLLLVFIFSTLWIRSYFASDALSRHARFIDADSEIMHHFSIANLRGRIDIRWTEEISPPQGNDPGPPGWYIGKGPTDNPSAYVIASSRFGFSSSHASRIYGPHDSISGGRVTIPHYALLLSFAAPALVLALRRLRRRRRPPHACRSCSYDLRAHNPGDRCPECGHLIDPAASQKNTMQTAAPITPAAISRRANSARE